MKGGLKMSDEVILMLDYARELLGSINTILLLILILKLWG